jgi:hypothetical protein
MFVGEEVATGGAPVPGGTTAGMGNWALNGGVGRAAAGTGAGGVTAAGAELGGLGVSPSGAGGRGGGSKAKVAVPMTNIETAKIIFLVAGHIGRLDLIDYLITRL